MHPRERSAARQGGGSKDDTKTTTQLPRSLTKMDCSTLEMSGSGTRAKHCRSSSERKIVQAGTRRVFITGVAGARILQCAVSVGDILVRKLAPIYPAGNGGLRPVLQ